MVKATQSPGMLKNGELLHRVYQFEASIDAKQHG